MEHIKVLIVDDERDVESLFRQSFRKELREGQVDFVFAFSAEEALEYLVRLQPVDVVLLLSDINMPGMNGLELLKQVKTSFPYLKVMMISAYGDEANKSAAERIGADDFFMKPVDFRMLKERVLSLIASGAN